MNRIYSNSKVNPIEQAENFLLQGNKLMLLVNKFDQKMNSRIT